MTIHHTTCALICCRGGSVGIPRKNIKVFSGKPLLGWILEAAEHAAVFDDVILSTDDEEIASVGRQFVAKVPFLRPEKLAQDDSDQFEAHRHAFEILGISDETHRICNLANNPFINSELIQQGYTLAVENEFSRIVLDAIQVDSDFAYFRQCFNDDGILRLNFAQAFKDSSINRQAIAPLFTTINNMRWAKPSILSNFKVYKAEIIRNGIDPVWLPKTRKFDLDDSEDWLIAETVFKQLDYANL